MQSNPRNSSGFARLVCAILRRFVCRTRTNLYKLDDANVQCNVRPARLWHIPGKTVEHQQRGDCVPDVVAGAEVGP
jgi:hypothetical protein